MKCINLNSLLGSLIKDYEKVYGTTWAKFKKLGSDFVCTYMSPNLIYLLNTPRKHLVGKSFSDFPVEKEIIDKTLPVFEKTWNGEEIATYVILPFAKNVVVYYVKAVQKTGKTDFLEMHCALLDTKDFNGSIFYNIH